MAKQLPPAILEQIIRASRKLAEPYHFIYGKDIAVERGTGNILNYGEYVEMRYRRMVEMLEPVGITEEQIAQWEIGTDTVTRRFLHFIPTYLRDWRTHANKRGT